MKQMIGTNKAPQAIGTYSQAIKVGTTIYLSGQIGMDPKTMELVKDDFRAQARQVFHNIGMIVNAAGGDFAHIVKLTIYLTDFRHYDTLNEVVKEFFDEPFPARSVVGVKELPKQADVEVEAVMALVE